MALLREQLQAASFRGIPFLVSTERSDRGKKTVVHEYPNSNKRFVEELGKQPPTYTFEAIVHGDDAIQQRQRLENALETRGLGELVHPVYGTVLVQPSGFSVSSNQTRIGEFRFSLNFLSSEGVITPTPQTATEQAVTAEAETAREALNTATEENYQDPSGSLSLTTAAEKLGDVYDATANAINSIQGLTEAEAADFNEFIDTSKDAAFVTAQKGEDIGSSLRSMYDFALNTAAGPDELTAAWVGLLEFNLGVTDNFSDIGPVTTVPRRERETNNSLFDENTRLNSLINAYESFAYVDYLTDVELDAARALLDDKYTRYIEESPADADAAGVPSLASDSAFKTAVSSLRTAARLNFDRLEQNIFRVVSIQPGKSSMALTAYRYYGSLDQLDQLVGLNPTVNVASFDADSIQAVTR